MRARFSITHVLMIMGITVVATLMVAHMRAGKEKMMLNTDIKDHAIGLASLFTWLGF